VRIHELNNTKEESVKREEFLKAHEIKQQIQATIIKNAFSASLRSMPLVS